MNSSRTLFALLTLIVALPLLGGCGAGPCERAIAAICQRACACNSDGTCLLDTYSDPAQPSTFQSYAAVSQSQCEVFDKVDCPMPAPANPTVDYAACEAAVAQVACTPSPVAKTADKMRLVLPAACAPIFQ